MLKLRSHVKHIFLRLGFFKKLGFVKKIFSKKKRARVPRWVRLPAKQSPQALKQFLVAILSPPFIKHEPESAGR